MVRDTGVIWYEYLTKQCFILGIIRQIHWVLIYYWMLMFMHYSQGAANKGPLYGAGSASWGGPEKPRMSRR